VSIRGWITHVIRKNHQTEINQLLRLELNTHNENLVLKRALELQCEYITKYYGEIKDESYFIDRAEKELGAENV